ncbi:MAG: tetratricopeptide repeat protein [Elusimicrobiota bacterium]
MRRTAACVLLVLAVWALYWPAQRYGFVQVDDPDFVQQNPHIRDGLSLSGLKWACSAGLFEKCRHSDYFVPLTVLSRMADISLYGIDAGGHHRTNILLHSLNAVLLLLVLAELTGALWPSAWAAAFFALHPLRVESVAWVTERKDVLSGFFWMAGLWAYLRYARRPGPGRYALVACVFLAGLLSKPVVMTFPLVLLLLDYWPLGRRAFKEKLPLLALSALFLALAWRSQGHSISRISPSVAASNAVVSCAVYLRQAVWPSGLSVRYPHPGSVSLAAFMLCGALLLLVSVWVFRERRRRPWLVVGWLWYLITLAPSLGFASVAHADRFTYLPLIGASIVIAALRMPPAVCAAALLALSVAARVQLGFWRGDVPLMERAVMASPGSADLHRSLGVAFKREGRLDRAIAEYERSLGLDGSQARTHLLLARALEASGRTPEAEREYGEVLRLTEGCAPMGRSAEESLSGRGRLRQDARLALGAILLERGDPAGAAVHLEDAMRLGPSKEADDFREALRLRLGSSRTPRRRASPPT